MKWPQYSLAYLMLEVFSASATMASASLAMMKSPQISVLSIVWLVFAILSGGITLGRMFHRMVAGFWAAAGVIWGITILCLLVGTLFYGM